MSEKWQIINNFLIDWLIIKKLISFQYVYINWKDLNNIIYNIFYIGNFHVYDNLMFNVTHTKYWYSSLSLYLLWWTLKIYITVFIINLTDDTANEQRE